MVELLSSLSGFVLFFFTILSDEKVEEACANEWVGDGKGGTPIWATDMCSKAAAFVQGCFDSIAMNKHSC